MSAANKYILANTGTTGNNTHVATDSGPAPGPICAQFVVEVAGATPTVTWKVQGSQDGTNFFDLAYFTDASDTSATAALTSTGVGAKVVFLDTVNSGRMYQFYRLVTSANTNITYRGELYCFTENAD